MFIPRASRQTTPADEMIPSVYIGDDANLIQIILKMHSPGPRVLDATYGHGRFWEQQTPGTWRIVGTDTRWPEHPPNPDHARIVANYTALPFKEGSFDAVICDPPFLTGGGAQGRMKLRYTAPANYKLLIDALNAAQSQFHQVLTPKGIVVVKTMDTIDGRRRRWLHIDLVNAWANTFRLKDMFVKVGTTNIRDPHWTNQNLSRAAHTFFLIFTKPQRNR